MRCAKCGVDNPAGKKFCGDCGTAQANPCPKCGADNPPSKRFCGECGASLTSSTPDATTIVTRRERPPGETHLAERLTISESAPGNLDGERKTVAALFTDIIDRKDAKALLDELSR